MFYTVCEKQFSTHLRTKYKLLDGGCQEGLIINDCISNQISEKANTTKNFIFGKFHESNPHKKTILSMLVREVFLAKALGSCW